MLNAKVILFFTCQSNGWEEVYYTNSTSLNDGYGAGIALAAVRRRLMAVPTIMDAIRVEDPAALRASVLTPLNYVGNPAYTYEADNVNTAAMMRLYATGSTVSRPLFIRGNPDSAFDRSLPNTPDAQAWMGEFAALGNFLTQGGSGTSWQIKSKIYPITSGGGKNVSDISVVGILPAIKALTQVTTVQPHGLAVNDYVSMYKIGIPRLSGTFKVVSVIDANNFAIPFHLAISYTYEGGGYCLKYTPVYAAIAQYANNPRWTRRATGRPFEVTRGRRRSIPR